MSAFLFFMGGLDIHGGVEGDFVPTADCKLQTADDSSGDDPIAAFHRKRTFLTKAEMELSKISRIQHVSKILKNAWLSHCYFYEVTGFNL